MWDSNAPLQLLKSMPENSKTNILKSFNCFSKQTNIRNNCLTVLILAVRTLSLLFAEVAINRKNIRVR